MMADCRLPIREVPPLERLARTLLKVRTAQYSMANCQSATAKGALGLRDVKNEGTSGDVYENTGEGTKCTPLNSAFCTKMQALRNS
jgi:hypothetical protein